MNNRNLAEASHPFNVARLIHHALLELDGVGARVVAKEVRRCIMLATGVASRQATDPYVEVMLTRCMLRTPEKGVYEVMPEAGVIYPIGWIVTAEPTQRTAPREVEGESVGLPM